MAIHRSFWSLGKKVTLAVVASVLLGNILLLVLQYSLQRQIVIDRSATSRVSIAKLIAAQVAGGVKFGKADAISRGYGSYLKEPGADVASIAVFGPGDEPLSQANVQEEGPVDLAATLKEAKAVLEKQNVSEIASSNKFIVYVPVLEGPGDKAKRLGILAIAWNMNNINQALQRQLTSGVLTTAGVLLAIVALLLVMISRLASRPLQQLTRLLAADLSDASADGDLEKIVRRRDEVGNIGRAIGHFRQQSAEVGRLRADQLASAEHASEERRRLIQQVGDNFRQTVGAVVDVLSESIGHMRDAADELSKAAEETDNRTTVVAGEADRASQNVETVAAAAEQLSVSVKEIARQVRVSAEVTMAASTDSAVTNSKIGSLNDTVHKIGDVTKLINDIANQTNLLALNATIEAARAGEAGKGFAVVASEVKSLANQTGRATEEISAQITAVESAANQTVEAIHTIVGRIEEIRGIASGISAAIEEQDAATQEIARNIQQAAGNTREINTNIGLITSSASVTRKSAGAIHGLSDQLHRETERLRLEVTKFLDQIAVA